MAGQAAFEIVDYNARWPEIYRSERAHIAATLGSALVRICHIGSTAVPELAAKPVVDLQAEVRMLATRGYYDAQIVHLGYASIDSGENDLRIAMRKRADVATNLHIVAAGNWTAQRTLLFRDALRADPRLVEEYATLKRHVARSSAVLDAYTHAKTEFVERVIAARAQTLGLDYSPGNRR